MLDLTKVIKYNGTTKSMPKEYRVKGNVIQMGDKGLFKYNGKRFYKWCIHDKDARRCSDCGGSANCEHGKRISRCQKCGGNELCQHGHYKTNCRKCGGASTCEHAANRSQCTKCHGGGVCEHGKPRTRCDKCGGGSLCDHGLQRSSCRKCGGGSFCEHDKRRTLCAKCNGGSRCEHGSIKYYCKICKGSQICMHNKTRSQCRKCLGGHFCPHEKLKSACAPCGGSKICKAHPETGCGMIGNPQYDKYCLRCFINLFPLADVSKNYRSKELHVVDFIKTKYPDFDIINNKTIPDGCSLKRPDLMFDFGLHVVVIEIDENQHQGYACENKRMMLLMKDAGMRPIVFIRFNPDKYIDEEGNNVEGCWGHNQFGVACVKPTEATQWQERLQALTEVFEEYIQEPPTKEFELIEMFFSS